MFKQVPNLKVGISILPKRANCARRPSRVYPNRTRPRDVETVLLGGKSHIRDDTVSRSRGYRDIASYHYILLPAFQVPATGPSIRQGFWSGRGK
jgi:hypothetical protein